MAYWPEGADPWDLTKRPHPVLQPAAGETVPTPESEPTVREVLTKAVEAGYIEEGDLEYLGSDLDEIMGNLYGIILEKGDDPDEVFVRWDVIVPKSQTE